MCIVYNLLHEYAATYDRRTIPYLSWPRQRCQAAKWLCSKSGWCLSLQMQNSYPLQIEMVSQQSLCRELNFLLISQQSLCHTQSAETLGTCSWAKVIVVFLWHTAPRNSTPLLNVEGCSERCDRHDPCRQRSRCKRQRHGEWLETTLKVHMLNRTSR